MHGLGPAPGWLATLLYIGWLTFAAYTVAYMVSIALLLIAATAESRLRKRQRQAEDYDTTLRSRFTIPVSVVAAAYNEQTMVVPAVRSLLGQQYPLAEVVLVDDGSKDDTLAVLQREFNLEPRATFFRKTLTAKPVRAVYRSRTEPRLTVISKENGGKADALNCGINFARYGYLCCVDGDTVYADDALLTAMSLVMRDPSHVVGAASLFGISREPETHHRAAGASRTVNHHLLSDFQHLDLMRSFVAYRLAWSRLGAMLCNPGGFAMWRRDVIIEAGGFSGNFTCEDIEMTFRVHEKFRSERRKYAILSLPHMVASTEGPDNVRALVHQRARWQRVTLETVWHYRRMLLRPRYGTVGLLAMPYFVFFEALAPVLQLVSVLLLAVSIAFNLLGVQSYLLLLGCTVFSTAIPTTLAVMLNDASYHDYGFRDLVRMMLLGPLDFVLYRPVLLYAGIRGTVQFLRGDKNWYKFERNVRAAAT